MFKYKLVQEINSVYESFSAKLVKRTAKGKIAVKNLLNSKMPSSYIAIPLHFVVVAVVVVV